MAPDLTSTSRVPPPPSPTRRLSSTTAQAEPSSISSSRRPSQPTGAASAGHSMPSPLPSPSLMRAMPPPETTSFVYARGAENGGAHGPGPLRHPRPITPAEMYSQLEHEQEAMVNRLTRELTQLRQQSASVASSASSTSASHSEAIIDPSSVHLPPGASVVHSGPLPIRHRRSSSGTSAQGRNILGTSATNVVPVIPSSTTPSQASIERAREGLSRQNSITSTRRSRASSPAQPSWVNLESLPPHYQHRQSLSSYHQHPYQHHHHPPPATAHQPPASSPTNATFAPSRLEDVEKHKAELEVVMRENEMLRRRIRELERIASSRRRTPSGETAPADPSASATSQEQHKTDSSKTSEKGKVKDSEGMESRGRSTAPSKNMG